MSLIETRMAGKVRIWEGDMQRMLVLVLALGLPITTAITVQSAPQGAAAPVTRADFERWKKELSNWGR
jgi:hypothetical protein